MLRVNNFDLELIKKAYELSKGEEEHNLRVTNIITEFNKNETPTNTGAIHLRDGAKLTLAGNTTIVADNQNHNINASGNVIYMSSTGGNSNPVVFAEDYTWNN